MKKDLKDLVLADEYETSIEQRKEQRKQKRIEALRKEIHDLTL